MSDTAATGEDWIVRYTWPADDANPYDGPQTTHEDPSLSRADAEFRAQAWRQAQDALGLKVNAEAVNRAAR
jgi:hypothetical protein